MTRELKDFMRIWNRLVLDVPIKNYSKSQRALEIIPKLCEELKGYAKVRAEKFDPEDF